MRGLRHPYTSKQGSRLYLCLYFPEWSIDVTRRKLRALTPARNPLAIVLTTEYAQHTVVARACDNARRAGVRSMMALSLANALTPEAHTYYEPFDPIRDATALHTLAVWCLMFSPLVGLDPELHKARTRNELSALSSLHYGIIMDLTGTERIHKDFTTLSHTIHSMFHNTACVALAPTIGGAWALSRTGRGSPTVALSLPALQDAVSDLPVYGLRIDRSVVAQLHDVGIYTIGQLLELPRHTLATRFGKHTVYRLSQLLGAIEERFHSVAPTKRYSKHKVFEPPLLHRHAITLAIEHLFTTLLEELRHNHSTAQLFSLILTDTTGHAIRKELPLASASHDPSHLSAIMQPIIDNLHFCGELRDILIEAHTIVSTHHEQQSFTSDTHQDPNVIQRSYNEMLNAFSVRIGKDRISYAHCTHSYIPERSFSYRSALETRASAKSDRAVHQPHVTYGLRERPPVLFTTPEPITTIAMLPDKPPSWIRWRNTTLSIISGIGPERIAPEWWQGDLQRDTFSERDYFTIQDTFGRWLWVFREQRSQQWFMHGVWT